MIQRVQSIYLLLITVLMSFLLVRPYAEFTLADGHILSFRAHAIEINISKDETVIQKNTIPLVVLIMITALISVGNIFVFSHRIVQIRICLITTLLLIAMLIIMFIYYSSTNVPLDITNHAFKIPVIFPFISIIFNLMAARAIHRDELLVNSYNRIR